MEAEAAMTEDQKEILHRSDIRLKVLTEEKVVAVAERRMDEDALTDDELAEFLQVANALFGIRLLFQRITEVITLSAHVSESLVGFGAGVSLEFADLGLK